MILFLMASQVIKIYKSELSCIALFIVSKEDKVSSPRNLVSRIMAIIFEKTA